MNPLSVAHNIDRLWCDVHGVYVAGWAHAHALPVTLIRLSSNDAFAEETAFTPRPDVAAHFGDPSLQSVGFAIYLACEPFRPVTLTIMTSQGSVDLPVAPPATSRHTNQVSKPAPMDRFVTEMKRMGGTVIEIGARVVGPASTLQASIFEPECRHIGIDIHAAEGVDIVVDAHELTSAVSQGSVFGVFSIAVMEHLAMPWLVAAEINAVLAEGGLVYHAVPQAFPVHEMPNDFWRMTDEGLKVLYGQATGFELIDAGMLDPVRIYLSPALRTGPFLDFPLHDGMATSYILARKTRTIPRGAVSWPLASDAIRARSREYPAHG